MRVGLGITYSRKGALHRPADARYCRESARRSGIDGACSLADALEREMHPATLARVRRDTEASIAREKRLPPPAQASADATDPRGGKKTTDATSRRPAKESS